MDCPFFMARLNYSKIIAASIFLISLGWLVPNHYAPWTSAWNEGISIFLFLLSAFFFAFSSEKKFYVSIPLLITALTVFFTATLQNATGKIEFHGDVLMVVLYGGIWLSATIFGFSLFKYEKHLKLTDFVFGGWLTFSIISVGIAFSQWLRAPSLGIYAADLAPGMLPFANIAQHNNFSTVCFFGVCALFILRDRDRVTGISFWFTAIFLLAGMASAQSRTGILQILFFSLSGFFRHHRRTTSARGKIYLVLGAILLILVSSWTKISEILLLQGRPIEDQISLGGRLPHWISMIGAIVKEPWLGYGWTQAGAAQQRIASEYPPSGEYFEHTHNFILDVFVWIGMPFGLLFLGCLGWWIGSIWLRAFKSSQEILFILSVMVAGVLVHGLLEFPLEYAYFLIPLGLAMGMIESGVKLQWSGPIATAGVKLDGKLFILVIVILGSVYSLITVEYLEVETDHRSIRMQAAQIGTLDPKGLAEPKLILDQLDAFQRFILLEARPGMSSKDIEWMRKVSIRFGYPPVLFRYALAAALNGQEDVAKSTLQTLCRIYREPRCSEARAGWNEARSRYSEINDIEFPSP